MSERIKEQIEMVSDVQKCSAIVEGGDFTNGDVALALDRIISKHTGSMTPNEYQKAAMRTSNSSDKQAMLMHAVLGLASEAGEVAGIFQKKYQGHPIDPIHLKKELGDCLWMIAEACTAVGLTLEGVMQDNIDKLWARYPNGFEPERSQHRKAGDI